MFDFAREKERFGQTCTACGLCVQSCPIVPLTALSDVDPPDVMEDVLGIFRDGTTSDVARLRVDSCMRCNRCRSECPEHLDPGLAFCLARQIMVENGDPIPRGLAFLLPDMPFNFSNIIQRIQVKPGEGDWVTDVAHPKPEPAKTVVFLGCRSHMQPDFIATVMALVRRIDPHAQALGGLDYCCGDMHLRAGDLQRSIALMRQLIAALDAFAPQQVLFVCPTCNSYFDLHRPETDWSWGFITQFLAAHIDRLGPLQTVRAKVALHDACNLARGETPDSDSPRRILQAIPGIELVEMDNCRENTLCCGGTALAILGKPGMAFRDLRLKQAQACGADLMGFYCTGCQSVYAPLKADAPMGFDSIINILGEAAGIHHEDRLAQYLGYHDGRRVVAETEEYIQASGLPPEQLTNFLLKYFR